MISPLTFTSLPTTVMIGTGWARRAFNRFGIAPQQLLYQYFRLCGWSQLVHTLNLAASLA
jgi:hypothetical protein